MRSRNIKPGFFKNDKLLECDPLARLLFAGLWCLADKRGRLEDRPKRIKIEILPCDNCDVEALLQQLQSASFIQRYELDGQSYIQVLNFEKHQHPHHREQESVIPALGYEPMDESSITQKPRALRRQAPDKARASPSDSLIPDSLIPCISLNNDIAATPRYERLVLTVLPDDWLDWTKAEMGWSAETIQDIWIGFRDYWQLKKGKSAQKSNWSATWRTWCKQQYIRIGGHYAGTCKTITTNFRGSKSERFKQALISSTAEELGAVSGSGGY